MTFPLALILVGIGFVVVGWKGWQPGAFFFHGQTVPA